MARSLSNRVSERAARSARESERGQVLIIVVGGIVALLGMIALAVDLGFWRNQQRQQQTASDAAAIAGSIRTYFTTTPGTPAPVEVKAAAQLASTNDGYTDDGGVGVTTVTVNNPPLSGTYTTDPNAVEVYVSKKQPVFFAGIFGLGTQIVTARSVARFIVDGTIACYYQLDPTSSTALGSGALKAKNCAIAVNGPLTGSSVTATGISYYGSAPSPGTPYNGPETKVPTQITDPCIRIPGCNYLSKQSFPSSAPMTSTIAAGQSTINAPASPGYLYVQGPIATPTSFGPGIYYIYGGISAALSGTGVTIVNVNGSYIVGGSSTQTLTAPTTGPTLGVAYYQPPSNSNYFKCNGAATTWNGLFYAPTAAFKSDGKADLYSELVVGSFSISGAKTVTIDPTLAPLGVQLNQSTTHAGLVE